jgi:hypothetical protein
MQSNRTMFPQNRALIPTREKKKKKTERCAGMEGNGVDGRKPRRRGLGRTDPDEPRETLLPLSRMTATLRNMAASSASVMSLGTWPTKSLTALSSLPPPVLPGASATSRSRSRGRLLLLPVAGVLRHWPPRRVGGWRDLAGWLRVCVGIWAGVAWSRGRHGGGFDQAKEPALRRRGGGTLGQEHGESLGFWIQWLPQPPRSEGSGERIWARPKGRR